jgi:hypothetical protein
MLLVGLMTLSSQLAMTGVIEWDPPRRLLLDVF